MTEVRRWVIGGRAPLAAGDRVLALVWDDAERANAAGVEWTPFHRADELGVADDVHVTMPVWRGYRFLAYLEWLVGARLAEPGRTTVTWRAEKKRGAAGLRRLLDERGWTTAETRDGTWVSLTGTAIVAPDEPLPRQIDVEPGLSLAADWGVFAAEGFDDGSALLLDVASRQSAVDCVADVGAGYGAVGLGLVRRGVAGEIVATEVDAVALSLAIRNAAATGAVLDPVFDPDPATAPASQLTVCNIPTHVSRPEAERLISGLRRRRKKGPVLVVVHASLEDRYAAAFEAIGTPVEVAARTSHSVLALARTRS